MTLTRIKKLTLGLAILGVAGAASTFGYWSTWKREPFNPDDCFSLEFHRYKLGKFIIDTPLNVYGSAEFDRENPSKSNRNKSFTSITHLRDRPVGMYECQLKAFVPYPAGHELSITYNQSSMPKEQWLRNREATSFEIAMPEVFEKYPATSYMRKLRDNLFKVDEIANIKVKSDTPESFGNPKQTAFITSFVLGDRTQQTDCNVAGCSRLAFQDADGIVYFVRPVRFNWKKYESKLDLKDLNNFNIVAAEDIPETVVPVLNFASSLRNREAEKDLK
jgi:hypothetical protein